MNASRIDRAFDFKSRPGFDRHLAREVEPRQLYSMLAGARAEGIEVRGPSHHGASMDPVRNGARATLDRWSATRALAAI